MLPNFYLRSYEQDVVGYNYATPLLARVLVGPLPRRIFPEKDELARQLTVERNYDRVAGSEMLRGQKVTIIGALYAYGGMISVVLGMMLLGWAAAGLDRLLSGGRPRHVRALGAVWMSMVWMLFASHVYWGLSACFFTGIPFGMYWLLTQTRKGGGGAPVRRSFSRRG